MSSPQELTFSPPPVPAGASGRDLAKTIHELLMAGAMLLFIGQLLVGTEIFFASAVFVTLMMVIFTCRTLGFGSIASLLIAAMANDYLIVSQIAKTLYGQPGDSNLAAPDTTIGVLFAGFAAICAAAILISRLIGERRIISVNLTPDVLANLRNISFLIGLVFMASNISSDAEAAGAPQYGGLSALTHQFSGIIVLPIAAETWRVLMVTRGRTSLSPLLVFFLVGHMANGFLGNSKEAVLVPYIIYLLSAVAYRQSITRSQLVSALVGGLAFVFFIYPSIQLLREERSAATGISNEATGTFLLNAIQDPSGLFEQWQKIQGDAPTDLYGYALNYLGSYDTLAGRFMLISNTDVIVNAVNEDGPYGLGLLSQTFEQLVPTFLYPDKPRDFTGDIETWYYGLRSWNVGGAPTIGIFADSFAIMGWAGVILLPFTVMLLFFLGIQVWGRHIGGNFFGSYFLAAYFHSYTNSSVGGDLSIVLRAMPTYYILVLMCLFLSDMLVDRQRRRTTKIMAGRN